MRIKLAKSEFLIKEILTYLLWIAIGVIDFHSIITDSSVYGTIAIIFWFVATFIWFNEKINWC